MHKTNKTLAFVCLIISVLFISVKFSGAASETPITTKLGCTSVPNLLADYKLDNLGLNATDEDVVKFVDKYRVSVKRKPDPFSELWTMTEALRDKKEERVLWQNDFIGVVVDKIYLRRYGKPKPLVIPKQRMNFISDASPELRTKLAIVAAATSDAIIAAMGKQCDPCTVSRIEIHQPSKLGVKQLHIHVEPRYEGQLASRKDPFYDKIESFLNEALKGFK